MNKLIFNDVGLWPHRLELCELARKFKFENNSVYFISSNDSIIGNPPNPLSSFFSSKVSYLLNLQIHKNLEQHKIMCTFVHQNKKNISIIQKKLRENVEIRNSIYGQYCELLCDGLACKESNFFKNFENKAFISLANSYLFISNYLIQNAIDEVVVWNGRRPGEVMLTQMAKENKLLFSSVITSQINDCYIYKPNWRDVNDLKKFAENIDLNLRKYLLKGFSIEDLKMSELYFKRSNGLIKKPTSFSSRGFYTYSENYYQSSKLDLLIKEKREDGKKIISIFPGTFMEYISLPNYSSDKIFDNHYEHIDFLIEQSKYHKFYFILRFHPNQENLKFRERLKIQKIINKIKNKNNFDVIQSNQNISSYQLINLSDLVIGIGSSISVEALRMNKKVIFLGCNWFQSLESLIKPNNKNELIDLLNLDIKPSPDSFRDSVLFTNTLFDKSSTKFIYYKNSYEIFNFKLINQILIKVANLIIFFSKKIFILEYVVKTFLKF